MTWPNETAMEIAKIRHDVPLDLLVLFDHGEGDLVRLVADVLGQTFILRNDLQEYYDHQDCGITVTGVAGATIDHIEDLQNCSATILMTHCLDQARTRNEKVTAACDYEYLYSYSQGDIRRDIARYLGFIVESIQPHDTSYKKDRMFMLSLTSSRFWAMLPDLNIMTIGVDVVELKIDTLDDLCHSHTSDVFSGVNHIGDQVALLRQATGLPIVISNRETPDMSPFSVDGANLHDLYMNKAKQWGCKYLDTKSWLPENVDELLVGRGSIPLSRGSSERSPPFSCMDTKHNTRSSHTPDHTIVPVTHSLLPSPAAPAQLTIPEINFRSCSKGRLLGLRFYAVTDGRRDEQAAFLTKYFNELNLPHEVVHSEHAAFDWTALSASWYEFGGAYLDPPVPAVNGARLLGLSDAAQCIGQIDTITTRHIGSGQSYTGDNVAWKGIRATLTHDHMASAYAGRAALVIANAESQASAAIYALMTLLVGPIYTIGFVMTGELRTRVKQLHEMNDLKSLQQPFVVLSALPADKSFTTIPLLKRLGRQSRGALSSNLLATTRKVYIDLAGGGDGHRGSVATAAKLGWRAYGVADVNAWRTVETLRLLVKQNVTFDFVRSIAGYSLST